MTSSKENKSKLSIVDKYLTTSNSGCDDPLKMIFASYSLLNEAKAKDIKAKARKKIFESDYQLERLKSQYEVGKGIKTGEQAIHSLVDRKVAQIATVVKKCSKQGVNMIVEGVSSYLKTKVPVASTAIKLASAAIKQKINSIVSKVIDKGAKTIKTVVKKGLSKIRSRCVKMKNSIKNLFQKN